MDRAFNLQAVGRGFEPRSGRVNFQTISIPTYSTCFENKVDMVVLCDRQRHQVCMDDP